MNKTLRMLSAFLVVMFLIAGVVGCSSDKDKNDTKTDNDGKQQEQKKDSEDSKQDETNDKKEGELDKIAFICADMANESQAFSSRQFTQYGKDYGFDVTVLDAKGNAQDESQLVTNCIAQGMKAIFLNPNDINAIIPSVKQAKEAGVIVGMFSADLPKEAQQYRDLFCGVNDTMAGEEAAKAFQAKFPEGAKIVEIGGQQGHDAAIKRHEGFNKVVEGSNIEVIAFQSPNQWATDQAMTIMEDMITVHGDEFQGVFCHWDNGCTGVIQALQAAGKLDDMFIVGVDGNKAGFAQVQEGSQSVTISQNFTNMSKKSLEVTRNILDGKDYEAVNFIPLDVITTENISEFPDPEW